MEYNGILLQEHEGKHHFEDLALAATHDRNGPNLNLRDRFIERHGLRRSQSHMFPSWLRVLPNGIRMARARWEGPKELHQLMSGVTDHDILYVKNGLYLYTTQPYNLTLEKYLAVEEYWGKLGVFVAISMQEAWWFPGRTPLVVISQIAII